MEAAGFWYRRGKLFDIGSKKHIMYILESPETFGLTPEHVRQVYIDFNEKFGFEGKAREALIKEVSKNGWIRVRHYVRPRDYWSIQYDRYDLREKDLKNLVAFLMLDKGIMRKDDEIILLGYEDGSQYAYTFMNGGASKFLQERKIPKKRKIIQIKKFSQFKEDDTSAKQQGAIINPVTKIRFSFPSELTGYTNVYSLNQIPHGLLTFFGRGIITPSREVRVGRADSTHVKLAMGLSDAKRFYYGYSRDTGTVYIVPKNAMDSNFLRKRDNLIAILSAIFDRYPLRVPAGHRMVLAERRKYILQFLEEFLRNL